MPDTKDRAEAIENEREALILEGKQDYYKAAEAYARAAKNRAAAGDPEWVDDRRAAENYLKCGERSEGEERFCEAIGAFAKGLSYIRRAIKLRPAAEVEPPGSPFQTLENQKEKLEKALKHAREKFITN